MHRDDVRMAEHGHRPGLAGEPLGEGGVLADLGREDFQRHEPVEPLLPGLVDHAHAAAADQLQNLQIGEIGRQFGRRGRHAVGRCRAALLRWRKCSSPALASTGSPDKALGGRRPPVLPAFGASVCFGHDSPPSNDYRSKPGKVTGSHHKDTRHKERKNGECMVPILSFVSLCLCGSTVTGKTRDTRFPRRFPPGRRRFGRFRRAAVGDTGGEAGERPSSTAPSVIPNSAAAWA